MKPFLSKVNLKDLPTYSRKKICSHDVPCETAITFTTFNDGIIICERDARETMYNLMQTLDAHNNTTWTDSDEAFLLDHYKDKGMYHGFYNYVADSLGKSRDQVKSKIKRMRKKGQL
jgi:hypothetical protein